MLFPLPFPDDISVQVREVFHIVEEPPAETASIPDFGTCCSKKELLEVVGEASKEAQRFCSELWTRSRSTSPTVGVIGKLTFVDFLSPMK